MLKSYVINLDRDAERLRLFQEAARTAGMPVERVVGVLGADLSGADDVKDYFCVDGKLAPAVSAAMKVGEIGNYASHLRVLKRVAASDQPALVFEDDTKLVPGFMPIIEDVLAKVPAGWDFVRLSNEPKRAVVAIATLRDGFELVRYSKISNSAMAYLVSPQGARKFLKPGVRTLVSDEDLRRPWRYDLSVFGVLPMPIGLLAVPSTIDALEARGARHNVLRRVKAPTDTPTEMIDRVRHNVRHLGARDWTICAALNLGLALGRRMTSRARSRVPRVARLT